MAECPTEHELKALLEQTLASDSLVTLEAHLADCDNCQQRMDALTSSADLIAPAQDLSSVPDSVLAQLRNTPHGHASTVPEDLPGRAFDEAPIIPGFDVHEHIASGASGALYRATDRKLQRPVALKVMHANLARSESSRQRLQRESRAIAAVTHPHVVAVHSTGEDDQRRPFMVMELIDGLSITEQIHQSGPFHPSTAAEIAEQAARGLQAAHASGLIHRDVKSSNILIERNGGGAKVVDFGLVREDTQETQLTMDGMLAGTPAYISPEQIINPTTVDARTDVYSLGIVLYEMLTGTVPFRGVVRMTLQQVQHSEPQPLRQLNDAIPRDLQTICLKAIEKDPAKRYQSASEFADDLQRFQANQPIVARPASRIEKSVRWCQRNPRVSLLSGLVAFAVLSTAGVTAASAYRLSVAGQEVQDADTAARKNAEALVTQRDAAMETVRKLVFDIPPMLQELRDDTSEVEKSILKIALDGLDEVGKSAADSGEVDYNTAHALQQLGFALYVAGEFEDSRTQLERCLKLTESMKAAGEPIEVTSSLVNEVQLPLSDINGVIEEFGNGKPNLQAAIDNAREWMRQKPNDADAAVALAQALRLLGDVYAMESESEPAREAFSESQKLLENAVRKDPNNDYASLNLIEVQDSIQLLSQDVRDPEADRLKRILQTELKAAEESHSSTPEAETTRATLVSALLKFARWHTEFGSVERADTLCDRAEGLFENAEDIPPMTRLKITTHAADALLAAGLTKPARNKFRFAIKLATELEQNNPGDPLIQDTFAAIRLGLADVYSAQGNGAKAEPLYQQVTDEYSAATPLTLKQKMLLLEAQIGLAWSAYFKDENATAAQLLADFQPGFEQLKSEPTERSAIEPVFFNAWVTEFTLDEQNLRDALDEQ